MWVRHVLVPGITDAPANLHGIRAFLDTLSNVEKVEILPYHTLGIYKWETLGIPYSPVRHPYPGRERSEAGKPNPVGIKKNVTWQFGRLARSLMTCFCFARVRILAEHFICYCSRIRAQ